MTDVLYLKKVITDDDAYEKMFSKWGSEKNILFVSPQLSGKHLYKSILPFLCLPDKKDDGILRIATAVTSLKPYDYRKQLIEYEIDLNDKHIIWADFIVFPFTTQPLSQDIYKKIRGIKPSVKIMYSVDFNFYELSEKHPYKNIFSDDIILSQVEDNMYFSDSVIVDNLMLFNYLHGKAKSLIDGKYKDVQGYMNLSCMPVMMDSEIVLKNVDYEPQGASFVTKPTVHPEAVSELMQERELAANKIKEDSLKDKTIEIKDVKVLVEKNVLIKDKKVKTKTEKKQKVPIKHKLSVVNKPTVVKKTANAKRK